MGFYQDITNQYGIQATNLFKLLHKTNFKIASMKNRRIFLLRCRKNGLVPHHIEDGTKNVRNLINYKDSTTGQAVETFNNRLNNKLINLEITITIKSLKKLERSLNPVINQLKTIVPHDIVTEFLNKQGQTADRFFRKIKNNNLHKFNNLVKNQHKFTINTQEGWIRNLSGVEIPTDILKFLALGNKFSLPILNNEIPIKKVLADLENIILHFNDNNKKNIIRAKFTNMFTNTLRKPIQSGYLHFLFKKTKEFFKDRGDLIVTRADKGNVTVILNKETYLEKSNIILQDRTYYSQLTTDPTSSLQQKANKLVIKLKNKGQLTEEVSKTLTIYDQVSPKYYGLPKIHKPTLSLRPIISSINAPNSKLSNLVTEILTISYNKNNSYYITDSFEFSNFIRNKELPEGFVVISLDVVSLFSNIPYNLAKDSVTRHWDSIMPHTTLDLQSFLEILNFIFDSTYCRFNDNYFKQILGTPMGATISPIISQYVMDDLLDTCIPKLSYQLPFLKKYVDDIITSIPNDGLDEILRIFNSYNQHIQFTVEVESNNSVPFLDTRVIRQPNNIIMLDWYTKPTSSGRYINYNSNHSTKIKINLILGLKTRISRISHPSLVQNNLKKLYNILLQNSYPKNFLTKLLFNTPMQIVHNTNTEGITPEISAFIEQNPNTYYYSFPYIAEMAPKITKLFKNEPTIKIAFKYNKTIGTVFTKLKDRDELLKKSNVVYSIPCHECNGVYVGQTSRVLKSRITQHKSDCRLDKKSCTLAQHTNQLGHLFNFNETKVLCNETNYNKRLFLEMVEIYLHPNTINKKTDIDNLSVIYSNILTLRNHNFENSNLSETNISI